MWKDQLTYNLGTIGDIIGTVALIMGIGIFLTGIFQMKKHGESRTMMSGQHTIAGPLMMLLAGAMLMALPTVIDSALLAFWGTSSPLAPPQAPAGYSGLETPILMFVRIIGVGSFIRGIVLLSRSGSHQGQPGTLGKALIHMFAGVLCVHIVGTLDLIDSILGLG